MRYGHITPLIDAWVEKKEELFFSSVFAVEHAFKTFA
jgi:hypothetical protein